MKEKKQTNRLSYSDFGKFLDPLADKLTQAAMVVCLISKYKSMIGMILLMVLKEIYLRRTFQVSVKHRNKVPTS